MKTQRHVVFYSGGAGSWAAAKRLVDMHGQDVVELLVADTQSEHDDWLPFVMESATVLGLIPTILTRGLNIWELAEQQKAIPNPRMAFCSRILKRELLDGWITENAHPDTHTLHFGFDWTEEHRLVAVRGRLDAWVVDAPLLWSPLVGKDEAVEQLRLAGVTLPKAYQVGLPHNNCLKFGCVKGGLGYWQQMLIHFPEAYARSESEEQRLRDLWGKNVSILRDRRGGTTTPVTLRGFRERVQSQGTLFDASDAGGACQCF